jgi:hypothetical protein
MTTSNKTRRFLLAIIILVVVLTAVIGVATNASAQTVCSPATSISVPFTKDGGGTFCYVATSLCQNINSWNMNTLSVNGTNYTNLFAFSSSIAPLNGVYTITYDGTQFGHFEIVGSPCSGGSTPPPATTQAPVFTPTRTNTPTAGPSLTPTRTFTPTVVVGPSLTPTRTPTQQQQTGGRQMERLNRGVVRVNQSGGNFISWRLLGTDPSGISFNVYQGSTKLTSSPITNSTNYFHSGGSSSASYTVRAVINGVEQADSEQSLNISNTGYLSIAIQKPAGGTSPDGVAYTYTANDASVGDLDGDGQYEIVLKWDPSNAKDNSQSGYTGNVYIDAYKLNGTRMWRIDMGRNIRAGAHYTQFQVYDYDGDGKAEVMMKTGDGTISGTGQVIGNGSADYRNSSGYILTGPEYLSVFNGQTGAVLATTNYVPARGTVSSWGDSYGNRVDRFLAGTAYLDGTRPSAIFARGYYTRTVLVAWDWRNGQLTQRWIFDSNVSGSQYESQGNHQLSVADVDADGKDEIMYGSMAINDNGTALWNNNTHHGDAYHVGDLIPSRPGLEVFKPSEHTDQVADWMGDARTGQIIWSHPTCGCDNGRGVSGDIWAGSAGAESWSSAVSGLTGANGSTVSSHKPSSTNFLIWWDADPVRELLDATHIDKYGSSADTRLLTGSGVHSNNGTKSTPSLSGDIFGDWREEVIWPASDDLSLRIYTTTTVTTTRIFTLLHDSQYRVALAWQNSAYNQPPHPSFFLGDGMTIPPQPNIYVP